MSFLGLCNDDPVVSTLTEVFGANIVKVPEERIKPLTVISSDGDKTSFRGALLPLLKNTDELNPEIQSSQMAEVSGKKTKKIDIDLGFQILDGFLKGFGIPSIGIETKFGNAKEVSFSFRNVIRYYIDINYLGKKLTGKYIDKENPAASIFFNDSGYRFLLLDSVITSSDFSISVDQTDSAGFSFDIPAIQNLINKIKAGIKVETTTGTDLIFKGDKQLGFAFSCIGMYLNSAGKITSLPPEEEVPELKSYLSRNANMIVDYTPDRVFVTRKPGMIELL